MMRLLKRYVAIRSYAKRLPNELQRRFGLKNFYTIEQVTKAAERGGFNTDFIAYAHSILCDRHAFDAHYGPMQVKCTYQGLRSVVARRYFRHVVPGFDAATIIKASRREEATFVDGNFGDAG